MLECLNRSTTVWSVWLHYYSASEKVFLSLNCHLVGFGMACSAWKGDVMTGCAVGYTVRRKTFTCKLEIKTLGQPFPGLNFTTSYKNKKGEYKQYFNKKIYYETL
ncbi:hypothetical protein PR048_032011 [Dryococelus australis]|uniref:Uncharacterized protein n=1 Tax=Dryococelus australis TaxID=614101 RepID=A0ABQ9G7V8_9NEOP|nr:hypothetical protein PR048_032011 [Dryococelus australis]